MSSTPPVRDTESPDDRSRRSFLSTSGHRIMKREERRHGRSRTQAEIVQNAAIDLPKQLNTDAYKKQDIFLRTAGRRPAAAFKKPAKLSMPMFEAAVIYDRTAYSNIRASEVANPLPGAQKTPDAPNAPYTAYREGARDCAYTEQLAESNTHKQQNTFPPHLNPLLADPDQLVRNEERVQEMRSVRFQEQEQRDAAHAALDRADRQRQKEWEKHAQEEKEEADTRCREAEKQTNLHSSTHNPIHTQKVSHDNTLAPRHVDLDRPAESTAPVLPARFRAENQSHKSRLQHPLYRTANHNYGRQKAEPEEMPPNYFPVSNHFTSTFNGGMYRRYGLNTTVSTQSAVLHDLGD